MLVHEHNLLYTVPGATPPCTRARFRTFETRGGTIVVATELPAPENPGLSIEECLPVAIGAWLDLKLKITIPFPLLAQFNSRSSAQDGSVPGVGDPTFSRVLVEYGGKKITIPFEFWTHFNSRSFAQDGSIPRVGDPTFSRVLFDYDGKKITINGREIVLLDDAAKRLGLAYDEILAL